MRTALLSFVFIIALILPLTPSAENSKRWALVNIPVACMREGRGHSTEMSSQAIMGTPMMVVDSIPGEWILLEGPDTYRGYVNISSLALKDSAEMAEWRESPRLVSVSIQEAKVYSDTVNLSPRNVVTELVLSAIVQGVKGSGKYTRVTLPDGRSGWVESDKVSDIESWASQPFDSQTILDRCYYLMGTPYLWGGCSTKSVDCSGLVRVSYYAQGILTLRDARQQIDIGQRIEPEDTDSLQPADLLFFSSAPDGRISHVAIYDRDGTYIHSSGRVKVNRMSPDDPDFGPRVYRGASRIDGHIGEEGIWQISGHPWYF